MGPPDMRNSCLPCAATKVPFSKGRIVEIKSTGGLKEEIPIGVGTFTTLRSLRNPKDLQNKRGRITDIKYKDQPIGYNRIQTRIEYTVQKLDSSRNIIAKKEHLKPDVHLSSMKIKKFTQQTSESDKQSLVNFNFYCYHVILENVFCMKFC